MAPASVRKENLSLSVLTSISIIAALYLAQGILIPLALAILFTFIATPVVNLIGKLGIPRVLSVALVCSFSLSIVVGIGLVIGGQLADLGQMLPQYQTNITKRVESLRGPIGAGVNRISSGVRNLSKELERRHAQNSMETVSTGKEPAPVPVQLVPDPGQSLHYVSVIISPVLSFFATAFIVTILSVFMLLNREDLRDRIIRLAGKGRLRTTTSVLGDAASRVSRYLLMQLIIFSGYGATIALGLYVIGVPNAALWGFICGVLKFVPYLGTWVGAVLPILVSLAVFDGWQQTIQTVALILSVEFVTSNFIEPKVFGATTGLSSIAVLTSTLFWTWLWGGVGLILATPMTVCLAVIGRNVSRFEFLSILLSDEPVLSPDVNFYQRLLAGDRDECIEIGDRYTKQYSLFRTYEDVVIPALSMIKLDMTREEFDETRRSFSDQTVTRIVDEASDALSKKDTAVAKPLLKVMLGPVSSLFDPLISSMLAQYLRSDGLLVEEVKQGTFIDGWRDATTVEGYDLVILAAVPPLSRADLRYALRRCKLQFKGAVTVCYLPEFKQGDLGEKSSLLIADSVTHSFEETAVVLADLVSKRAKSDAFNLEERVLGEIEPPKSISRHA